MHSRRQPEGDHTARPLRVKPTASALLSGDHSNCKEGIGQGKEIYDNMHARVDKRPWHMSMSSTHCVLFILQLGLF